MEKTVVCEIISDEAHELYHLWFNGEQELILSSALEEEDNIDSQIDDTKLRANRFAAEFLVEENILRQEMKTYGVVEGCSGWVEFVNHMRCQPPKVEPRKRCLL